MAANKNNMSLPVELERPQFGQCLRQVVNITSRELEGAIRESHEEGERLGAVLERMNLVTREHITQALKLQASYVATAIQSDFPDCPLPYPGKVSLCLPAYNEELNVVDTLDATCAILPEFFKDYEVVVVDDGSVDRTGDLVREYSEKDSHVRLVTHETNQGYGAAVRTGLLSADGEFVAFMDSDGQFSPLDIPQLMSRIDHHGAVIGYRHNRADPWLRRLNAWGWNRVVRTVLGLKIRDLNCALKLFRKSVVDQLEWKTDGAGINAEILVQVRGLGHTIAEVPVLHYPRVYGNQTGANFGVILRAFKELPKLCRVRKAVKTQDAIEKKGDSQKKKDSEYAR